MPDLQAQVPRSMAPHTRWKRLSPAGIPVMLVHPRSGFDEAAPVLLWMHGRTVNKELDSGRYLRWMRAGIAGCAIDLPGHGERFDPRLQEPDAAFEVVTRMGAEIDTIMEELRGLPGFDLERVGIGGMSAGGMATILRLCEPHPFRCACLEATSGSWMHQQQRAMFDHVDPAQLEAMDPLSRLGDWREIPVQAIHTRVDEWVDFGGQEVFVEALRDHYENPELVEFVQYERTGALFEHAGFGRFGSDAKNRQVAFLRRHLAGSEESRREG